MYEKSFKADWKAVKKGLKKVRAELGEPRKVPTSVALDPRLVADLKKKLSLGEFLIKSLCVCLLSKVLKD